MAPWIQTGFIILFLLVTACSGDKAKDLLETA